MKASTLLLSLDSDTNVFNGHLQTELKCVPQKELEELLEEIYNDELNQGRKLFLSLYEEKGSSFSLSIYQKNYWKPNENKTFVDRMVLSVDKIYYKGKYEEFINSFIEYIESKKYLEYEVKLNNKKRRLS